LQLDEERWEALLEVLKLIEVGVLGAFLLPFFKKEMVAVR